MTSVGTALPGVSVLSAGTALLGGNALLGLAAAALWGGGDFAGSMAVKRGGSSVRAALRVVVIGHLVSMLALVAVGAAMHDPLHLNSRLLWAAGGGCISGLALMAFYLALANGHMGASAAVSGLLCAALPAGVSAWQEGAPGWRKLLGFALAGAAIWLIASSGETLTGADGTASRRAMLLSVVSGVGFGVYFVALKMSSTDGIIWPTVAARVGSWSTSAALLSILSMRSTRTGSQPLGQTGLLWIVGGALLDLGGNLSFVAAARAGRLDVAAVLASLYPAGTILLAAALLKERTSTNQKLGMALALPAVVLITL